MYAYYLGTFGRNGINGTGGPTAYTSHSTNYILSATSYSSGYVNAFWSSTSLFMTYGDGDGSKFGPTYSIDVTAHEMTHGIIASTSMLTYSGESGALNESMSDVFGVLCKQWRLGQDARRADDLTRQKTWLRMALPRAAGQGCALPIGGRAIM